jgi:hypothetical protein
VYEDPAYAEAVQDLKAELKRLQEQYQDDGTVAEYNPPAKKKKQPARKKA